MMRLCPHCAQLQWFLYQLSLCKMHPTHSQSRETPIVMATDALCQMCDCVCISMFEGFLYQGYTYWHANMLGSNILMHIVHCTLYSTPIVMATGALCQIYDCVKQTQVQFIYWALIFTGQRRRLVCKTTTSFQCIKENMFGKIQNW